jgi:preprotein translocase subunit SecA
MRIFASDRLGAIMQRLGMKEGEAIISPMVTRSIERAQKRVEERNFSSRKHLLEYDDVMNQQRQVIYGLRNEALNNKDGHQLEFVTETTKKLVLGIVSNHSALDKGGGFDLDGISNQIKSDLGQRVELSGIKKDSLQEDELVDTITKQLQESYESKFRHLGKESLGRLESYIFLTTIDRAWKNNLLAMDHLRDSVSLRSYGQRDPLQEYKKEAFRFFETMMARIFDETTQAMFHLESSSNIAQQPLEADEPDEDSLTFRHPEAAQPAEAPADERSPRPSDDGMIYHGSRAPMEQERTAAQPKRRTAEKVGRNDPCPCGSGKKYKKCHGALEAVE